MRGQCGDKAMMKAREGVISPELCWDGVTGHLVQARTAITAVRQGDSGEKQSPAVFIFGSRVLCLEAE